MRFLDFQKYFSDFLVIPVREIEKNFPGFDRNVLTRWQKKGYLVKIRKGYYMLLKKGISSEARLFVIANKIYTPSYISLHTALGWYNFIPEGVFSITSVGTKKTTSFDTPEGTFDFRSIRKELFFGYQFEKWNNHIFKIASPEKALLDFFYLEKHLNSPEDIFELRLNSIEIMQSIDLKKMDDYLSVFSSKALEERIRIFKETILVNDIT